MDSDVGVPGEGDLTRGEGDAGEEAGRLTPVQVRLSAELLAVVDLLRVKKGFSRGAFVVRCIEQRAVGNKDRSPELDALCGVLRARADDGDELWHPPPGSVSWRDETPEQRKARKEACPHVSRRNTQYVGLVCQDCHTVLDFDAFPPAGKPGNGRTDGRGDVEPRLKR